MFVVLVLLQVGSPNAGNDLELKSIKLYMWSYRDEGAFHEDVTNRILDDFVAIAAPRFIEVIGDWRQVARKLKLSGPIVAVYASAFEHEVMDEARTVARG